jgi:predicted RNA-binding protein YlqC (UPF0109 family)
MSKTDKLQKIHILLHPEDVEKLKAYYGNTIGFSRAVREIVHRAVTQIDAKASKTSKPLKLNVDLDIQD